MKSILANSILLLILQITLSGCIDFEPDLSGVFGGGWGSTSYGPGNYNYYPPEYAASFGIDSVVQETDTTFTIWGFILYDSTLIIHERILRYYESYTGEGSTSESLMAVADTIHFRNLPDSVYTWWGRYEHIYKFHVPLALSDTTTNYTFCIDTEYKEKRIRKYDYQCRAL